MKLMSLFDGSGGFPLAASLCGIKPIYAAEVEPYPIAVTKNRFPKMKHLGDVSKVKGGEIEPVDIITFGSPCQDMSIAGKRAGLKHADMGDGETTRSGLFLEAIRIIKEMREATNGVYPRYAIWENVPGAFSSNRGEDFRTVLEEFIRIKEKDVVMPSVPAAGWAYADCISGDGWSVAYRTFDAQYWGVPQRRRRIYLVADFRGGSAKEILFECKGLRGDTTEVESKGQGTTGDVKNSAGETSTICLNDQGGERMDVTEDVTNTLRAESHHPPLVFENHSQDSRYVVPLETAQTVLATYGTGGNNQPFVVETPKTLKIRAGCEGGGKGALVQDNKSATLACNNDQTVFVPKVYGICAKDSNSMKSSNPHSGIYEADTTRTLDTNGGNPCCNQGGMAVVSLQGSMIGREDKNGSQGDGINEDISFTLNTVDKHAVAYGIDRAAFNQGENAKYDFAVAKEVEPTMVARGPGAVAAPTYCMTTGCFMQVNDEKEPTIAARDFKDPPVVNDVNYIVRRLTPTECAKLQGFPSWWGIANPVESLTDEDYAFWLGVRNTYAEINGKATKEYTKQQMLSWYNKLHSDSAEYKMWGNGIALPNALYVMQGIAEVERVTE